MDAEIIYEKKYPRVSISERVFRAWNNLTADLSKEKLSHDEIMNKIHGNLTYTPIPERIIVSEQFIREAIDVSKLYKITLRIERQVDCISANFYLDCGGGMRYINRVLGMADRTCFFKDVRGHDHDILGFLYPHRYEKRKDRCTVMELSIKVQSKDTIIH